MKTNWKCNGAGKECYQTEIDGFWVEADSRGFSVGNGDSDDLFIWAENDEDPVNLLSETWELETATGATDAIPDETWGKIEEAVAELRKELRKGWADNP